MKTFANNAAFAFAMTLTSAGLTGCFEVSESGMTGADYDAVAAAMGALVTDVDHGQAAGFASVADLARGVVPAHFDLAGEIAYADRSGLSYSLGAVCSDAAGRGALCGEDAAIAHIEASWNGEWTVRGGDAASEFDGNWVFDLSAGQLDGGASATALVFGERVDFSARYDGVVLTDGRATAGVVSYDITTERELDGALVDVAIDGELAFAADGSATLTLDGVHVYRAAADGSVSRVK